jgi:hypothetical protein
MTAGVGLQCPHGERRRQIAAAPDQQDDRGEREDQRLDRHAQSARADAPESWRQARPPANRHDPRPATPQARPSWSRTGSAAARDWAARRQADAA